MKFGLMMKDISGAEANRYYLSRYISENRCPSLTMSMCRKREYRNGREIDGILYVSSWKKTYELICEFKSNGQPKNIRSAIHQLKAYMYLDDRDGRPTPRWHWHPSVTREPSALCRTECCLFWMNKETLLSGLVGSYKSSSAQHPGR